MIGRIVRFLPAVLWMALIFVLSSQEQLPGTFGISAQLMAIVGHLLMYGLLAILLLIAFSAEHPPTRGSVIAAILCTVLYGISDEFHQSFVPGRQAGLFDVVVNTIGAIVGIAIWLRLRSTLKAVGIR